MTHPHEHARDRENIASKKVVLEYNSDDPLPVEVALTKMAQEEEDVSDVDDVEVEMMYDSDEGKEYMPHLSDSEESDSDESGHVYRIRQAYHTPTPTSVVAASTSARAASNSASAVTPRSPPAKRRHTMGQEDPRETDLVQFTELDVQGRNGHCWSTKPTLRLTSQTPRQRITAHLEKGPRTSAMLADTASKCLELLFDDDFISEIVKHTNSTITTLTRKFAKQKVAVDRTTLNEIRALLGVLIFSGARKDNFVTTEEMWNPQFSPPFYRAAMSERRFCFLLFCLCFDNKDTREERIKDDRLAPIRYLWDQFIYKCGTHYAPGENLTVDEQLLGFRGRCGFRMYIANKPAKYGLKLAMACDAESKYMLNAIPYLGKHTSPPSSISLGHHFTKELVKSYNNSRRNVTTDNWFTSVPLVCDLMDNCGLTLVGTLRADKPYIPPNMVSRVGRRDGSSAFIFDREMTMVSYKPPIKDKLVLLLSTMHSQPVIDSNGKPEIINFYNKTKGAVDAFDRMCGMYSCSRSTKRWSLCLFYGMINAAVINAWIIFNSNQQRRQQPQMERRLFMKELALQLVAPWAEERISIPTLQRSMALALRSVFNVNIPPRSVAALRGNQSKRCALCDRRQDKKTKSYCASCQLPVCNSHFRFICLDCL